MIGGENGMLVADEAEMTRAIGEVASIDPLRCRSSVAERYDVSVTVIGYERVYCAAMAADRAHEMPARRSHELPRGSTATIAGEHWQRPRTVHGARRRTVSSTAANGELRAEIVPASQTPRADGA